MKTFSEENSTDVIDVIVIRDTSFAHKTGLAYDTAGLTCYRVLEGGTLTEITLEDITTLGTYEAPTSAAHMRFKELDATNAPGAYEVHLPNDWFSSANGHRWVYYQIKGTGLDKCDVQCQVNDYTPQANITVSGTVGTLDPGNRIASPISLEMFKSEAKTFLFGPKIDSDGNAVDLSGKTLRMVVTNQSNVTEFQVDGGSISGDANGNAQATVSAGQSAAATDDADLPYVVWNVTDDEELWNGSLYIRPAQKGT